MPAKISSEQDAFLRVPDLQDSCTSKATINNLILLEPSLRVLGVPFDAQIAFKMMQGIPGTASKLLYQVD